jgi:hypothetical protein
MAMTNNVLRAYPKISPVINLRTLVDSYRVFSCATPSATIAAINKRHKYGFGKKKLAAIRPIRNPA